MENKEIPKEATGNAAKNFGPLSAIVVTLGAFFGSQLLAGMLIGAGILLTGKNVDEALKTFGDSTLGQFMFIALVETITIGFLFWFMRYRKISKREIGLGRKPISKDIGYGLICFGIYFILAALAMAIVKAALPSVDLDQEQQIGFEAARGTYGLIIVFISLVILPPIVEEIMIRGFLYSGLRRKLSKPVAIILASSVFAAAHLQLGSGAPPLYVAAIDTFVLSVVLIILREKTGALWSGMFVHGLKNGLAFLALFIFNIS